MEQLILHLIGDYVTQSDWMAHNKTKAHAPALAHAAVYSLPFFLLGGWVAVLVIFATHFLIDRYRLARRLVWFKNVVLDPRGWIAAMKWDIGGEWHREYWWGNCKETGYPSERPAWLSVWLLIAADNTLHLAINYCALRWL